MFPVRLPACPTRIIAAMPTTSSVKSFFKRHRRNAEHAIYGRTPAAIESPEPIYISHRTRSLLLWGMALGLIWLVVLLPGLVQVFALGATMALVLSFPMRFFSQFMSRAKAIALVTVSMVLLALLGIAAVVPFLVREISQFAESLPSIVTDIQDISQTLLTGLYDRGWITTNPETVISNAQDSLFSSFQSAADNIATQLVTFLTSSMGLLITTFGVIFVAIYLLADIPRFKQAYTRLWAPRFRKDAEALWETVGYSLSRYLAGLVVSLTLQGVLVTIGMTLLGVPYAVVLGVVMSVTAIIPYIGSFVGGAPGVLLALTIGWPTAIAAVFLYVGVNILDGNVVVPRVQGSALKVHPLLIFFFVIGGSNLFGPFGAILAVPTLAIFRVIVEFFWLRLRVREDRDTVLSLMRNDMTAERIASQSSLDEEEDDDGQSGSGRGR